MSRKIILCRCEDVTLHDLEESLALGYADIEEVKRYTGFGTGPCQGKECLATCALVLADKLGVAPDTIAPFTARPPLVATALKFYAGAGADEIATARDEGAHDEDHGMAG